jgi:hypothetical protein
MEKMLEWQYSDFFAADKPDFIISEDRVEANRVIMRHRSYKSLVYFGKLEQGARRFSAFLPIL